MARGWKGGPALSAGVLLIVLAVLASWSGPAGAARSGEEGGDLVQRGAYLVSVMGCHDCHTPHRAGPDGPVPDTSRMLSGHPQDLPLNAPSAPPDGQWQRLTSSTNTAFFGPWGVSFASNLTAHAKTGIGGWSFEDFKATMTSGRHLGTGRELLPPMGWNGLRQLHDDDLRAIFAYLRSIPRVDNRVPEPLPLSTAR